MRALLVFCRERDPELLRARRAQRDHFVAEVDRMLHLIFVSQAEESLTNDVLEIRLADVDDVIHGLPVTERRMNRFSGSRRRDPDVSPAIQMTVVEVLIEESELPELVRDVLADVRDGSVGSDDDLVIVVSLRIDSHDPAALVLAFGFEKDRITRLELFERIVPELEVQDVALARQQVVAHADAFHRREMALHDCHRDQGRHFRGFVAVFFDLLQCFRSKGMLRIFGFIKGADPRVQIPAVVVELEGLVGDKLPHVGEGFFFEVPKSHDDIGNLNAGVVDVVLNFHMPAARLENADERVADCGVAEMPDVCRLVGIDVRVLDNDFPAVLRNNAQPPARHQFVEGIPHDDGAIEKEVDIARSGQLDLVDSGNVSHRPNQFFCDGARSLFQLLREFKADRRREFAQLNLWRLVENNVPNFKVP